jgi:hypothetical protein
VLFETWGATDDEVRGAVVGDDLVPEARLVATRAVSIDAPRTSSSVAPQVSNSTSRRLGRHRRAL